jgi:hypothetical protein
MENINHNVNTMEDYNQPSPERAALLEQLQKAIDDVPPHFWAACQICDLKALERLVTCGREYPDILLGFATHTQSMAYYCTMNHPYSSALTVANNFIGGEHPSKGQSKPSTPTNQTPNKPTPKKSVPPILESSPSTPPAKRQKTLESPATARSQRARNLADQRDNFHCVLTMTSVVRQIAHIYPHHSIRYKEDKLGQRYAFWRHLRNFWSEEKIAIWQAELFPSGIFEAGVERVYNLITLSSDAHRLWAQGGFALKPISMSDDKMTLKIQFFWQKRQENTHAAMSLLATPHSTKDLNEYQGDYGASWLYGVGRKICSGDYFDLQTDDPETKPLPSFQLLELQWFLQRVVGMAGAADIRWPSLSESDPDEELCQEAYEEDYEEDYEEMPDLSYGKVGDSPFDLLSSPNLVRNDNSQLPESSKHNTEEVEGDRIQMNP